MNYVIDRTIIPNLTVTSLNVPLLKPGTKYLDRWNQIDLRLARKFEVRALRFQAQLDFFNLLNSDAIGSVVETYGPNLDSPSGILQGRLIAIGGQLTF